MWQKYLATFFLFYLLAVLQTSFFAQLNLFGSAPNLVFALFFILVFFEPFEDHYYGIFSVFTAGFFLDVFSSFYFGASIILLLALYYFIKKILGLFKKPDNEYPFAYFISLFVVSLILYNFALSAIFYFLKFSHTLFVADLKMFLSVACSSLFSWLFFMAYKKFFKPESNNKQFKLFRR